MFTWLTLTHWQGHSVNSFFYGWRKALIATLIVALAAGLMGCTATAEDPNEQASAPSGDELAEYCEDPRPEMCTHIYLPVCALRDTSVRCVTEPCPSTEWKTYGNQCAACSDSKVIGFNKEACPEQRSSNKK